MFKDVLFKERMDLLNAISVFLKNEENKIVSLDGEWGSGKSFFIDTLCGEFENSDVISIKFDCWENQTHKNINNIFLEYFLNELCEKVYNNNNLKDIFTYLKKNGLDLCVDSIKTLLEMPELITAVAGIEVDLSKVNLFKKLFNKAMDVADEVDNKKVYEEYNNRYINDFIEENDFYEILTYFLFEYDKKSKDKKILLIFDELDRCEPSYAMEVIKKIVYMNKKLKNKKINFLIAFNKIQFTHILQHYYGEKYDADQYYDKIFSQEFMLTSIDNKFDYLGLLLMKTSFGSGEKIRVEIFSHEFAHHLLPLFNENKYRKIIIIADKLRMLQSYEIDGNHKNENILKRINLFKIIFEITAILDYKRYYDLKKNLFAFFDRETIITGSNESFIVQINDKENFIYKAQSIEKFYSLLQIDINERLITRRQISVYNNGEELKGILCSEVVELAFYKDEIFNNKVLRTH